MQAPRLSERVANTNDGSGRPPSLRLDISLGNLIGLPPEASLPMGDPAVLYQAARDAGFAGVQDGDPALCAAAGLRWTASGRVNAPGEVSDLARAAKDRGCDCLTLHVGWGLESDEEMDRLVDDVLDNAALTGLPLYIETHRATITQDIWRTVYLVQRYPEVRFNADLSHWYTGQEMVYGDLSAKWTFLAPVWERVRFVHGRIGNPGSIQVAIATAVSEGREPYVAHFREMWTRCFAGFLRAAGPGDYICFTPELLGPTIYYARYLPDGHTEESDRWQQAGLLSGIARECFAEARRRLAEPAPQQR